MDEQREMPIFVKIDEYKDILDIMDLLKNKIAETKAVMGRLNDIKNEEDAELDQWRNQLDEIDKRINFIDRTLFEPEPYL
jgi:division protein CdvB (Snf7/Vps24/ESCRT-III family)